MKTYALLHLIEHKELTITVLSKFCIRLRAAGECVGNFHNDYDMFKML